MAGTLTISTLSDGTNSTSATNLVKAPCVAWVNFNGTGTVAIRASYNVSSITDNGTGLYTVNFTNALTDANYAAMIGANIDSSNSDVRRSCRVITWSASSVAVVTGINSANSDTKEDFEFVSVSVFR